LNRDEGRGKKQKQNKKIKKRTDILPQRVFIENALYLNEAHSFTTKYGHLTHF
jgi:hypothetical protein